MRILVANFDNQKVISKAEVIDSLLELPEAHLRGIQVVRYDPCRQIAQAIAISNEEPFTTRPRGSYYHAADLAVIVIYRFSSKAEFRHILFHEVAHYVFLKVLSQAQRDKWMYQIRKQEVATVSAYAARNSREDFAENYAAWKCTPQLLNTLPMRREFIRTQVFAG